jgi:hypothetical protein
LPATVTCHSIRGLVRSLLPGFQYGGLAFQGIVHVWHPRGHAGSIAPEPILLGLRDAGYYIWREGSNPHGTAQ